jgi:glyceraldehyde 3-phosphate dehydrogenase
MAKIINDNFKIKDGIMTTVHGYTADQRLVDAPHKDLRRGKAAALNIVPTTTGAAKAICLIIPELNNKLIGTAVRVPVPDGSLCHFIAEVKKKTDRDKVNQAFKDASEAHLANILEFSTESLVSTDIIGNPHSCILDSLLTECIGNNVVVVGWYDNEWGYSSRMIDVAKLISNQ